jgi:helicase SWR1
VCAPQQTIMTISMLAHLASEKGIWGQHLVVAPTSTILNWQIEFLRWLPSFKILCYHGSAKERRIHRKGWSDPNAFHVCITSYQLIVQDQHIFKRKHWHYMILDEAHHIKNFKSQRWQSLLTFRTDHRLLLTGTPLQNNMIEVSLPILSLLRLCYLLPAAALPLPRN